MNPQSYAGWRKGRSAEEIYRIPGYFLLIALVTIFIVIPAVVGTVPNVSTEPSGTAPVIVYVNIYVVDFNRVDIGAGTVGVDFYLNIKSDNPVSINDLELMNGIITSTSVITDTPYEKEYRIVAVLTVEPDLSRYPFDKQTLPIKIEPKLKTEQEMVLVLNPLLNGLDSDADLPGWIFTNIGTTVSNKTYIPGEIPYSRAVFYYEVGRDTTSTVLKFFLPIVLIIIVSLSSLLMKISSRMGLNGSMFLAAVLIHWRIADAIPLVGYATFLDLFMIITYATLVMVLISGILILKFTESGEISRKDQVDYWSLRIIPSLSITLYFILFLSLII